MYRYTVTICKKLGGSKFATYKAGFIIKNESHYKQHERVIYIKTTSIGQNNEPVIGFQLTHPWIFDKQTGKLKCRLTPQNVKDYNFEDAEIDKKYQIRKCKGQHWVKGGTIPWHIGIVNSDKYGTAIFPEEIEIRTPTITKIYHPGQIVIGSVNKNITLPEILEPGFNDWGDWIQIQRLIFIYYINNRQIIDK